LNVEGIFGIPSGGRAMQRGIGLVLLFGAATAWAAAPPAQPRALTAEEQKEVAALDVRLSRHGDAGEFEQAAKVAAQIAVYRKQRQGAAHWQAIEARFAVDGWRQLIAVPGKDRPEVVRAWMSFHRPSIRAVRLRRPAADNPR
jgi:hypothetical protein